MKIDQSVKEDLKRYFKERMTNRQKLISVVSACPLDEKEKNQLLAKLPKDGQTTRIEYQTDPKIIAGIILRTGTKVLDLSLRSQLLNLKRMLYENS